MPSSQTEDIISAAVGRHFEGADDKSLDPDPVERNTRPLYDDEEEVQQQFRAKAEETEEEAEEETQETPAEAETEEADSDTVEADDSSSDDWRDELREEVAEYGGLVNLNDFETPEQVRAVMRALDHQMSATPAADEQARAPETDDDTGPNDATKLIEELALEDMDEGVAKVMQALAKDNAQIRAELTKLTQMATHAVDPSQQQAQSHNAAIEAFVEEAQRLDPELYGKGGLASVSRDQRRNLDDIYDEALEIEFSHHKRTGKQLPFNKLVERARSRIHATELSKRKDAERSAKAKKKGRSGGGDTRGKPSRENLDVEPTQDPVFMDEVRKIVNRPPR